MRLTAHEIAAIADSATNKAHAAVDPLIETIDQVKHYLARCPDLRAGG